MCSRIAAQVLDRVSEPCQAAGIQLELLDYPAKDSRQGKPAEDKIITGSRKAQVLLTVGNPLITRKVLVALPKAKFVQWFGPGHQSYRFVSDT